MNYAFYVADTETTGLDSRAHDIIEISILRLSDGSQKLWRLKPINTETIDSGALRVNGHKMEDLKHLTKYGQDTYLDPSSVLIDIENWLAEDGVPAENRFLIGQNISFDKERFEQLWVKCNAKDSFPFGRRMLDTMIIELFLDFCKGSFADSYSLSALTKKYGVKNEKAHSADADTRATKEVFLKQVEIFKSILNK